MLWNKICFSAALGEEGTFFFWYFWDAVPSGFMKLSIGVLLSWHQEEQGKVPENRTHACFPVVLRAFETWEQQTIKAWFANAKFSHRAG